MSRIIYHNKSKSAWIRKSVFRGRSQQKTAELTSCRCNPFRRKEGDSKCGALAGRPLKIKNSFRPATPVICEQCLFPKEDCAERSERKSRRRAEKLFSKAGADKKTAELMFCRAIFGSGKRGIRTPGTLQFNGFQDRRNRPLCHLSGSKSNMYFRFCQMFVPQTGTAGPGRPETKSRRRSGFSAENSRICENSITLR